MIDNVEIVTTYGGFLRLEPEWNEAVERMDSATPFLRHEWLQTWWDSFGGGSNLHVVVVRSEKRVVAIAPLMYQVADIYGVPVRMLRLVQNAHTQRADIITTERSDELYRLIWQALLDIRSRWDVCLLSRMLGTSSAVTAFSGLAATHGCPNGIWHGDESPFLALRGSWDEYITTLSVKFRQNLRNRLSRLTRVGEPRLEVLESPASINEACETACRLEASGWKQSAGSAICSNPSVHRFYTLLAERAAERGWLRLLFLSVDGRRIAAAYAASHKNRLLLFKTGYDPEYAQYSPFKLLTYFAIRHAFATGLAEVDFLGDREAWKLEWTQTRRPHDWLFVFADSARGRLLHTLKFRLAPLLRWLRG